LDTLPRFPDAIEKPFVEELHPGIYVIGTPLSLLTNANMPVSVRGLAWGTVELSPSQLITSILYLSREKDVLRREADELRTGLGPHLEQISYDFEELSYLRRLGELTDLRDVSNPLADLAERILEELCSLVRAESLIFIGTDSVESPIEGEYHVGKPVAWIGARSLSDSQCAELIENVRRDVPLNRPVVQNRMSLNIRFNSFPGINSYIQVPVIHRGTCYGWMLALNRIQSGTGTDELACSLPSAINDGEFGTGDASLMTSAAGTLAAHYRNSELFREREVLLIGVVRALINAIDAKDSYTCGHSDRVAFIAKSIGEHLGLDQSECERLYMSGLLHDLGKIGIPDHILLKPGKLTDEEFAVIRQHPTIGHSILRHLPQLRQVLPGVLHHHESLNGNGYPLGLSNDEIPLFARILAVADSYDAMTSARPYRSAMTTQKAEAILNEGAGTQWDRQVVTAFMQALPAITQAGEEASTEWHALQNHPNYVPGQLPAKEADTIARAVAGFAKTSAAKTSPSKAEMSQARLK
ncbi:MAG: hypothetical protein JWN70_5896, partial [Planctomycetaceae bacterium]|nr:hypothetical protein [Planctomycetaceae bacterium]